MQTMRVYGAQHRLEITGSRRSSTKNKVHEPCHTHAQHVAGLPTSPLHTEGAGPGLGGKQPLYRNFAQLLRTAYLASIVSGHAQDGWQRITRACSAPNLVPLVWVSKVE